MKYEYDKAKLVAYGFKETDGLYTYQKDILDKTFRLVFRFDEGLKYQVFDLENEEEYHNHLNELYQGPFVNKLREMIVKTIDDIRKNCATLYVFNSPQVGRIEEFIKDEWGIRAEFLWKDSNYAVFRNAKTLKWFAIIMDIDATKLGLFKKDIDIINLKLPPYQIDELLKKPGFYRAYHMNKKYWISLILDDTLSDQKIMDLVKMSYQLVDR